MWKEITKPKIVYVCDILNKEVPEHEVYWHNNQNCVSVQAMKRFPSHFHNNPADIPALLRPLPHNPAWALFREG